MNSTPLDTLPDTDIRDALALRRFLLVQRLPFVHGAPSTIPALALERAGIIKLRRFTFEGLKMLEVMK